MSIPLAASALVAHMAVIPIIRNIYPVISTIREILKDDNIIQEMDNRDIEASLSVIEGLVLEINKKKLPKSILKALKNLEKTLVKVQNLLEKIHKKTIEHSEKWFSKWRSLDISKETNNLIYEFDLLEKRFNLFHKILLVYKDRF